MASPAVYNVGRGAYDLPAIAAFNSLQGWDRDASSRQLVAVDAPNRTSSSASSNCGSKAHVSSDKQTCLSRKV